MLRRQQSGFCHAQGDHRERRGKWHPNDHMHPKRRTESRIYNERQHDNQRAYAHGKQRSGAIADIIAAEIKATVCATVSKLPQASEQGFVPTLGAETKKGRPSNAGLPFYGSFWFHLRVHWCAPATPDVNGDEEEQPDDIDKMPIPRGGLKPEMLLRREMAFVGTSKADS